MSKVSRLLVSLAPFYLAACQLLPDSPSAPPPATSSKPVAVEQQGDSGAKLCACDALEPVVLVETEPCPSRPAPVTVKKPAAKTHIDDKLLIGRLEYLYLQPDNYKLKSRIDTGAGLSSLSAQNMVFFERDGDAWVRFDVARDDDEGGVQLERPIMRYINIKQHNGQPQRRPVVSVAVKIGNLSEQIEVSLTDRSGYLYTMLVGRNFLRDRAIVDVSAKFLVDTSIK